MHGRFGNVGTHVPNASFQRAIDMLRNNQTCQHLSSFQYCAGSVTSCYYCTFVRCSCGCIRYGLQEEQSCVRVGVQSFSGKSLFKGIGNCLWRRTSQEADRSRKDEELKEREGSGQPGVASSCSTSVVLSQVTIKAIVINHDHHHCCRTHLYTKSRCH